jgi:hypothetical protein
MSNDATNIRVVLAEKAWQEGYALVIVGASREWNVELRPTF